MTRVPVTERRSALVQAAFRVISSRGIAEASTRSIVAEAGMSLASFHYAFDSRDALIDELVRTVVAAEQAAVLPAPEPGRSLEATIVAGLERYLDHLREAPGREQAMLELTWYALRSPERHPLAQAQYARYAELAARALAEAAEAAGATWRVPVAEAASVLVAFTDGLTVGWLVQRDEAAAAAVIRAAADSLSRLAETP